MRSVINHFILIAGVIFMMYPVIVVFASSTHETAVLVADGLQVLPGKAGLSNFWTALTMQRGFTDGITAWGMLQNSFFVATGIAVLTTVFSFCAAYGIVYFRWTIAGVLFWVSFATILFPLESRFITTFQVTSTLGLIDTYTGMILPTLACGLGTLFFRQTLLSLPEEILEAAVLDGASPARFFVDHVIPLCARRIGVVFMVTFFIGWHQYLWPLLISTDENHYTIVRGIRLIGQESGPGMALISLSVLPPLILTLTFARCFFDALAE